MHGGISGFPRRAESEYDTFGTAHSSTSISAALGMAVAAKLRGREPARSRDHRRRRDVGRHGVRGAEQRRRDGRRPAGDPQRQRHVDLAPGRRAQQISGAADVGRASTARRARQARRCWARLPPLLELAKRVEEHVKGMVVPSHLFEEFGFNYIGPIDGHDLDSLVPTLKNIRELKGPQFLHVVTQEGPGLQAGRGRPACSITACPSSTRTPASSAARRAASRPTRRCSATGCATWPRRTSAWSASRRRCAKARAWCASPRNFPSAISTSASPSSTRVTFAAGLACEGLKPVVAIYSTFLQRAYDQLIHDVAIQNLPVVFAHRPRRAGRRRRRDAQRRFRSRLSALHSEHDGDGAGRRERMPADAVHRVPARHAERRCAIRAAPARASRSARRCRRCRWARAKCAAQGSEDRDPRIRQHARARARRRPRNSTRRWPTCASSSRWTRSWC